MLNDSIANIAVANKTLLFAKTVGYLLQTPSKYKRKQRAYSDLALYY